MSAASATESASSDNAKSENKGKKKLFIIIAIVMIVLLAVGAGVIFMMQKKAAEHAAAMAQEDDSEAIDKEESSISGKSSKPERPKELPFFVPLDPFVVNLANKDSDRFAQVGLNFQVEDEPVAAEIKNYMPAIRNAILLILSHKTSEELLSPEGKEKLAKEIKWGSTRAMGYDVPEEDIADENDTAADEESDEMVEKPKRKSKKKKKKSLPYSPILQVNYATFVVQ